MRALLALPVLLAALGAAVGAAARGTACRWTVVLDRPGPQLTAVAAIGDRNVWAVGSNGDRGAILHWDGHGWWPSVSPIFPLDVAASSARDVWIVGTSTSPGLVTQAVSDHWNGSDWALAPVPGGAGSYLRGVSRRSSTFWAVGASASGPLIVRWTGRACQRVRSSPVNGVLRAIDRGWAVGTEQDTSARGSDDPLVEHLTQSRWQVVASSSLPSANENLMGVDVYSVTEAWAVGNVDVFGQRSPLVQRLNGRVWVNEPVNGLPQSKAALLAVVTFGANNVWAAGFRGFSPQRTLLARWDGTRWTQAASRAGSISGLSALNRNDIWAVGGSAGRSLIEHYTCSS